MAIVKLSIKNFPPPPPRIATINKLNVIKTDIKQKLNVIKTDIKQKTVNETMTHQKKIKKLLVKHFPPPPPRMRAVETNKLALFKNKLEQEYLFKPKCIQNVGNAIVLKWNSYKPMVTKNSITYLGVQRADPNKYRAIYANELKPLTNFKMYQI